MRIGIIGYGLIGKVLAFHLLNNNEVYILTKQIKPEKNLSLYYNNIIQHKEVTNIYNDFTHFLDKKLDLIIICTKVFENLQIAHKIKSYKGKIPPLILAQNGLFNDFEMKNILNNVDIFRMSVGIKSISENNIIKYSTPITSYIGPINKVQNKNANKIEKVCIELHQNNVSLEYLKTEKEIQTKVWYKGIINCCLNALSAIYKLYMKDLLNKNHRFIYKILKDIANESVKIARKIGININKRILMNSLNKSPATYSSMSIDIENNTESEINYLNGMIVKLGIEYNIKTPANKNITNLILSFNQDKIFISNDELCKNEYILIKELFNEDIIYKLKLYLSDFIIKLNSIGYDEEEFMSDDYEEMGNIGRTKNNFKYLTENNKECTVREKLQSVYNIIFDSKNKRPKNNALKLVNYIFLTKSENKWNEQRVNQLKDLTNIYDIKKLYNYIYKNNNLWAPIIFIYPSFSYKRFISANLNRTTEKCTFDGTEFIEPLSNKEKRFLKNNIESFDINNIPFKTGECDYKPIINLLTIDKSICNVAGISGHTILGLELAKILNMDWKPMLLALMLIQVPYHHSINEIMSCINIMSLDTKMETYEDKINAFKNYINNL